MKEVIVARPIRILGLVSMFLFLAGSGESQDLRAPSYREAQSIPNWPAPLLWSPPGHRGPGEARTEAVATVIPLPFVAVTPCRVADTRGNGFTGAYGPPSLVAGATRSFTITGQCGVAASAAAVSFNFAALNVGAGGDLRVFPAGGGVPLVSTLNYNANTPNIANAAIVPLGAGGAITVQADATSIDLIIDVNGYYDGNGVITGVMPGTGMTGGGTSGTVTLGIAPAGVTSTELASNSVTSTKIAANAVTAGAIASGNVVKDLNGVHDSVTVAGTGAIRVNAAGSTITLGGGTPSGSLILGAPGDTTIVAAGYTELGPSKMDFWRATSTTGAPTGRQLPTAVWTGSRMVVWGGVDNGGNANSGGQYDPAADSWTATTATGAPAGRREHAAVWTGTKMIVWGGSDGTTSFNTGGQYDPVGNSWTATTTTGAPAGRRVHTAVWTGSKMIVWGGTTDTTFGFNSGGQYDPAGNSWTATTTTGAPAGRFYHTAVWTGSKMIVWGGTNGAYLNTGGLYDPAGDSWSMTTTIGAPGARTDHTAVWTGTRMIVWGGYNNGSLNTGGQYDPAGDSWTAGGTTTSNAPAGRFFHIAVWTGTGSKMIVWGGNGGTNYFKSGGQYDSASDSWTSATTIGAPSGRYLPAVVWTGSKMIVWGGLDGTNANTGGQYGILSYYLKN